MEHVTQQWSVLIGSGLRQFIEGLFHRVVILVVILGSLVSFPFNRSTSESHLSLNYYLLCICQRLVPSTINQPRTEELDKMLSD